MLFEKSKFFENLAKYYFLKPESIEILKKRLEKVAKKLINKLLKTKEDKCIIQ